MDAWFKGYDKTFRELLPALVEEYDGTRDYTHGSPDIANWGRPHSSTRVTCMTGDFGTDNYLLRRWLTDYLALQVNLVSNRFPK